VEDEDGVRKRIVNTLSYYFGAVFEAKNGEEGLELYYEHLPNIVICDIQMPVMDGVAMVREIRKEDKNTAIVMLTAYTNEDYLMKLINLNIQHYILKPMNVERLLEGISIALEGKYTGLVKICENILLDLDNLILKIDKKDVSLSVRETKFLKLLSSKNILSYTLIEEELWADKPMSVGALKSFVRDLRKKIDVDIIENITQQGYKLDCENL
jgi:DNA-binding response OmpR family regulator